MAKARRQGHGTSSEEIRTNIHDIAGVRVTCGFTSDTSRVRDMLPSRDDVTVLGIKDYIKKPNGYKSLHALLPVPVFMADGVEQVSVEQVSVEVQIRTIAMDFWSSWEHRIYCKSDSIVPQHLLEDLREAAEAASGLDREMEHIHAEVSGLRQALQSPRIPPAGASIVLPSRRNSAPDALLGTVERSPA